jgi:hypothetical protein
MGRWRWLRAVRDFFLTVLLSACVAGGFFAADYAPRTLWIRPHEPSYKPTMSQKLVYGIVWGSSVGALLGTIVALNRLTDPSESADR